MNGNYSIQANFAPNDNFPSGWGYRKQFTINGSSGGAQTNYQMKLNVYKSTGTDSGGSVYLNNHSRGDFADVRFTKSDGTTLLDYWQESVSGSSAVFWVEFDAIPQSGAIFYIYYGNNGAASASNGANTFPFFDDFPGSTIDGSKWNTVAGSPVVSGGILTVKGNPGEVLGTSTFGTNYAMRSRLKSKHYNSTSYNEFLAFGRATFDRYNASFYSHPSLAGLDGNYDGTWATSAMLGWAADTYAAQDIIRNSTTSGIFKVNDSNTVTVPTDTPTDVLSVMVYASSADSLAELDLDWVYVRKYVSPEPTWGTWGNETSLGDGFPSGWAYRKQFTINGSSGGAQTNYQMKLNVYKSTGTDSGDSVYLNYRSRDDFADVRFTKADGTTLLDYWQESYVSGSSAVFWVEFDSLPASPSSANFYIYYGNSGAASASNGANTFPFFDDFSGSSLDGTKWTTKSGAATVTGGEARLQASTWIYTNNSYSYNQAVRARVKSAYFANASYNLQLDFANIDTDSPSLYGSYALFSHPYAPINGQYSNYNGTHYPLTLSGWTADAYHTLDIERAGTTSVKNYVDVDNANEVINSSGVTAENHRVWLYSSINDGVIADWVLVRKYVSPEPAWGTWGNETSQ